MPALLIGPLGKILGIAALVVALFLAGEWHGRKAIQLRWDAAVAGQAIDAAENVIKNAENTALILDLQQQLQQARDVKTDVIRKVVKVYVDNPAKKCVVSPEFERAHDTIGRVHNAAPDSVPAAASPPTEPPPSPEAPLTDAAILTAYASCAEQLYGLWDAYSALAEWVRSSYVIAREGAGRSP